MKGLLKFITCGSVDDGKSTLIGHLLYDAKLLYADQQQALELDSKAGSRDGKIDYSLLLDGLMAEREQGITIDVAYRYFNTDNRSFIVADTPGHEEYTRNMAVGASFAELAVILVDSSKGIMIQTRRHARICAMMGIRHFIFALNKMDLVGFDEEIYRRLDKEVRKLAIDLDLEHVTVIPVSATEGDNITQRSRNMSWYTGETLLSCLENIDVDDRDSEEGFYMPVQRVCRPNLKYRGFQGHIEAGEISVGDEVTVLPSGEKAHILSIMKAGKETDKVRAGDAASLQFDREIDVSRGCVIEKDSGLKVSGLLRATILWMDEVPLTEGQHFYLKLGTRTLPAEIMRIRYRVDINTGEHEVARTIMKNEIVSCEISLSEKIVLDSFAAHRTLGSFILINRVSNMTSACGTIAHIMRRSDNLHYQQEAVTRHERALLKGQEPYTIWFTGLSGSGKSTLANEIEKRLHAQMKHTMLLDGDNMRMGLNKNLGFTKQDRIENIRRTAEVCKILNDAGLIALTAFISPYEADRDNARQIVGEGNFIEVYVCTSLEECKRRDTHGLYRKALAGEIPNMTGITSPYEIPSHPEVIIDTEGRSIEETANELMDKLGEIFAARKAAGEN